jgi:hypothetical protein
MGNSDFKHALTLHALDHVPDGGITREDAERRNAAPADAFMLVRILFAEDQEASEYAVSTYDGRTKSELTFGQKLALWLSLTAHLCSYTPTSVDEGKLVRLLKFAFSLFAPPQQADTSESSSSQVS